MPYPTRPIDVFSFTAYAEQAANGYPGSQHDDQDNQFLNSVNETIDFLQGLANPNGTIKNEAITPETFAVNPLDGAFIQDLSIPAGKISPSAVQYLDLSLDVRARINNTTEFPTAIEVADVNGLRDALGGYGAVANFAALSSLTSSDVAVGGVVWDQETGGQYVRVANGTGLPRLDYSGSGGVAFNILQTGGDWFQYKSGLRNDTGVSQVDEFNELFDWIQSRGGGVFHWEAGVVTYAKTFQAPVGINWQGAGSLDVFETPPDPQNPSFQEGTQFVMDPAAALIDERFMLHNINPSSLGERILNFPPMLTRFRDFSVRAFGAPGDPKGILVGGPAVFENIQTRSISTAYERPNIYQDTFYNINCKGTHRRLANSNYIELNGRGDDLFIRGLKAGYVNGDNTGLANAIDVSQNRGGTIEDCVNGNIYLRSCESTKVSGCHLENGSITADNSACDIFANHIYRSANDGGTGGQIRIIGDVSGNGALNEVYNNRFIAIEGWEQGDVLTDPTPEIVFSDNGGANLEGNVKMHVIDGNLNRKTTTAALISVPNLGTDNDFNEFAAALCTQRVTVVGETVQTDHPLPRNDGNFNPFTVRFENLPHPHPDAGSTFYVNPCVFYTSQSREIGRYPVGVLSGGVLTPIASELAVTIPPSDLSDPQNPVYSWPILEPAFGLFNRRSSVSLLIKRGVSSLSYNQEALVHLVNGSALVLGATAAGVPWGPATGGSSIPTLQNQAMCGPAYIRQGNLRVESPINVGDTGVGSFKVGDIIDVAADSTAMEGTYRPIRTQRLTAGSNWVENVDYRELTAFVSGPDHVPVRRKLSLPTTASDPGSRGDYALDSSAMFIHDGSNWNRIPLTAVFATTGRLNNINDPINTQFKDPATIVYDTDAQQYVFCKSGNPASVWFFLADPATTAAIPV